MAALAKLTIDLEAKLASFAGDLGKAARASEETAKRMNSAFGSVKATLVGLAAGVSLQGIISFAKATIDSLDALNDLKDATGSSIENISALEDVARRTGTSFDTVSTSLIKFNKVLGDAKPGSETESALKAIGLSATELKQIDPAEALLKTATALAGFADDGNKARITQELFGKSLKEVAPFLKDLAEKGELNATVTTKQAEEAEKFNKQLSELKKNSEDTSRALVSKLIPEMNRLLAIYIKFREQGSVGTVIKEGVLGILGASYLTNQPGQDINRLLEIRAQLQEKYNNAVNNESLGTAERIKSTKALNGEIAANEKLIAITQIKQSDVYKANPFVQLSDKRVSRDNARLTIGDFAGAPKTGPKEKPFELKTDSLDSYIESLRKELEVKQELTTVEKTRNLLAEKGNVSTEDAAKLIGLAQQIDKEKELTKAIEDKREANTADGSAKIAKLEKDQERLAALLADTSSAKLQRQNEDIELLKEKFEQFNRTMGEYGISEQQYIEAIQARVGITAELIKDTSLKAKDFGDSVGDSFADAVMAGKDLQSVIGAIGDDLAKLILRRSIINPAADFLSGAVTSGLGAIFGGSFDGGGYTGGGARSGGMDGRGGFMAMLHPNETVIDHTKGQSAGGITVVQNFTVGDVASVSLVRQAVAGSERRIASAMGRSRMYAGAMS